ERKMSDKAFRRPAWDEYFMKITHLVAERSTCLRRRVGAVIVRDKQIISTGYNGSPKGLAHCLEIGCLRDELGIPSGERHELCRGAHAEQNAIIQAAGSGSSMEGATMYCTNSPCSTCTKMIINAGIKRLVLGADYPDQLGRDLIRESGIETIYIALAPDGSGTEG
ncbi:MAG TPA: cytidine/deoxycytidylate deaminase family protein, partial [Candidatus Krumholzibacterium sp.]|nr:cytidine/deoxycytidylate deaminase family protein [Candidatus Krumholzibacterium sp.]